jgi:hypothetical protein
MKKLNLTGYLLVIAILIIACSKKSSDTNTDTTCDTVPKTFSADANPLFQTYCNQTACHNSGSTNGPGPLTNYTQIFAARNSIRGVIQAGVMPQNTTLTTAQKNTIICWIDAGAPNN